MNRKFKVIVADDEKLIAENIARRIPRANDRFEVDAVAGTGLMALELAREQLSDADAEVRHVIFLSDGEPSDDGFLDIVEDMAEEGITLTAIALGYSSPVLSSMASVMKRLSCPP